MAEHSVILNAQTVHRVLTRIAHEIVERNERSDAVALVGIQKGGVLLAERLGSILQGIWGHNVPVGKLDVGTHRDDLNEHAAPLILPTVMPFDINGRTVVLVDDVLYSGRTTRAALDALNDFGRPRRVQLAVLVDRGHRELPIKPDFVGKNVETKANERIDVRLKESHGEDVVYLDQI
ncbi:MAG TPA: bifunctional pyr operon transcriptional regulator/uracil phosphoribosyltransferase PyrR [Verrucomicrobiae bacterium]|nr:bifunctional pyr operon transcriptional regulator/uracil phosphoribosyltransferase PyrR [Verrucomicrobiae bacterium]